MTARKVYRAIGLMSGTSVDGVDAALIETDGMSVVRTLESLSMPYDERVREKIRKCFGLCDRMHPDSAEAERHVTHRHANAVVELMAKAGLEADAIDVIGFHGQTLLHVPEKKITWQIGDGGALARQLGIDVVNDFRSADVKAGGQGAPFLPLYHGARVRAEGLLEKAGGSIAILNIGGVANVTWIGPSSCHPHAGGDLGERGQEVPVSTGTADFSEILAFDTGPGNALMDDYIYSKTGQAFDENGAFAATGQVDQAIVDRWMALPYFAMPLPKSLDRNSWDVSAVDYLSAQDALATLAQFTASSVAVAERLLPEKPKLWMVTGGGRHNAYLMARFSEALDGDVRNIDDFGWDGDAVEAEGFAYLAVRSMLGLPLSLPSTTGVPKPQTGGVLHKAG